MGKIIQLIDDGVKNVIINGVMDWVYEEEFVIVVGFKWLLDGKYFVFMWFDESGVKEFMMMYY